MERIWLTLALVAYGACSHDAPRPAAVPAVAPTRGAAGDLDLRVMLSELASSKACAMIRGGFQGLRAPDDPGVVTGVLWIRECAISNVGLKARFHIAGNGWLWLDQTKSKSGGTFVVRQYVRFSIATTIQGAFDLAYDRDAHVATVWFTPDRAPAVDFKTIGDIDVDAQDVWSSVVGAVGTAFASSPEDVALGEATSQGRHDFSAQLAEGLAVIVGPQRATDGLTLRVDALKGGVHLALVCAKDAETLAADLVAGRSPSRVPVLASVDARGTSRLTLEPTTCPVVVVATPLDDEPARFAWERPTAEIAGSTGGPLIHCPTPTP